MEQNYLPLFRKYRPQSFKDIVGQESLVKALSNAIELNRIANAYLFCGPRGTGKTSSARIFAKSLNCVHGPTLEPCQKCPSCVDITNATGLDVIEIDAASNRGIQDAKELISQVQYAPINGKYKIFIIDEVHMLSNDAFNALLKTFEEPPKNVIFILATTEPHKVLETIVSRCQRFDLKRITIEDIIKRLREISDLENIKITDDALFTIAKNVSGGLRDSLALLDQVSILGVKEEIDKELIEELLGKINFDVLLNLLKDIYEENIEASINDIENIYTKGNEPRNLAENFIEFLRNVILTLNSTNDEVIQKCTTLIKDDIDKVRSLNFDKDKIIKILNVLIEYYKEIKVSTNPYLWMELAGISACKLDLQKTTVLKSPQTPLEAIKPNIEPRKVILQKVETENEVKETVTPETATGVVKEVSHNQPQQEQLQTQEGYTTVSESEDGVTLWTKVLKAISSPPTKAFYSGMTKLVKVEDKRFTLGFMNDNLLSKAKDVAKTNHLKTAIKAVCPDYEFEYIIIDSNTKTLEVNLKPSKLVNHSQSSAPQSTMQSQPSAQNPIKKEENKSLQEETEEKEETSKKQDKTHYSPEVQEMIEQFNGRIIE